LALTSGTLIGFYQVTELLGAGGMGGRDRDAAAGERQTLAGLAKSESVGQRTAALEEQD
jgi:hypothetical protein